ncbi:uncharacterized protein BKA55DRAFT_4400 [Fusarium redolens]|uniref:Uncharacterized protein n=1 Tax=Fusarium redolens TaxID=48865 RepID=A0A9P9KVG9_FUSRE|nr:uncharacterized protein BKA55DRAFT_4400 [Fusarium redolens]KAH7269294.1 hypothetical protein BKA55DRAFT_4400 [Fusarium redolens]
MTETTNPKLSPKQLLYPSSSQSHPFNMVQLSTDAIITLVSTIPGLIVSCLSAWFAYLALHRRPIPPSDIETAAMLFMIPRAFSIPPSALSHTDSERTLTSGDVLQLPPATSQHCLEPSQFRVLEHAERVP